MAASWFSRLFGRSRKSQTQGVPRSRWAPTPLSLERLEDRLAPATLTELNNGTTLLITLDNTNEAVGIESTGSTYVLNANTNRGTFNLVNGGVANAGDFTGFGTSKLTMNASALARYSAVRFEDSAAGTAVIFADSGTNAYSDAFTVALDNSSYAVIFAGTSRFGNNALNVQADGIVFIDTDATVSTGNGGITLEGNLRPAPDLEVKNGVAILGTLTSTGTGNLAITGRAADQAGKNQLVGVVVKSGVISSTGTGTITVVGTGGAGTSQGVGVAVDGAGSLITSVTGAIQVTGTAGAGTDILAIGVTVAQGAKITSTGTGATAATVTINGTGAAGTSNNSGVRIEGANAAVASVDGKISIVATPAPNSRAFEVRDGGQISVTGSADVEVRATSGELFLASAIIAPNATVRLTAEAGDITGTNFLIGGTAGSITAKNVGAFASGTVGLGIRNTVDGTFAARAGSGDVNFTSTVGFTVGTVSAGVSFPATAGVTAGNSVNMRSFSGAITINQALTATAGGVDIIGGQSVVVNANVTGGDGDVSLTGTGQEAGDTAGVVVQAGAVVTSTGLGQVSVNGRGGSGSNGSNYGVAVGGGGQITSGGGDVTVQGGGGSGSGGLNHGVFVSGGTITAGGTGQVAIFGSAGSGGTNPNYGVYVVGSTSAITSGGGQVVVQAFGASGSAATRLDDGGAISSGNNATVQIAGDSLQFGGTTLGKISAGTGAVYIGSQGALIDLGGNDVLSGSQLVLGLSLADLGQITAGLLLVGGQSDIKVTAAIDVSARFGTLALFTPTSSIIDDNATGTDLTVDTLILVGATGIGSGNPLETEVSRLTANNTTSGTIEVSNTGALTLAGLDPTLGGGDTGITNPGDVIVTTTGDLTIDAKVSGSAVTLTSTGGTVQVNDAVTAVGGPVTIAGDSMRFADTGSLSAGAGLVTLKPVTPGTAIDLGGADAPGTLGLSAEDLAAITAGTLAIGDGSSGAITVTAAVDVSAKVTTLALTTGENIVDGNGTGTDLTVTNLALVAASGIGSSADPLDTAVSNVEAQTDTGGIFLNNTGNLTIGGVDAGLNGVQVTGATGDISLTNAGGVFINLNGERVVAPGAVVVAANGADADLLTGGGNLDFFGAVRSTGSTVTLTAGRNLSLGDVAADTGGDVNAIGNVILKAGGNVTLHDSFVDIFSGGTDSTITVTAGGDIALAEGSGGGSRLQTISGDISLTAGANGVLSVSPGSEVTGVGVHVAADDLDLQGALDADAGRATLVPVSAGRAIDLGTDTPGRLSLTGAELAQVTAAVLQVGDVAAGDITVSGAVAPANVGTLTLITGGGVGGQPGGSITVENLRLSAAGPVSLTGVNDVETIAAAVANSGAAFTYNDADAVTIGTVDGVSGLTTTDGAIVVTTTDGDITVAQNVSAGGATVDVHAGTQASGHAITNQAAISNSNSLLRLRADAFDLQPGSSITSGGPGGLVNLRANTVGVSLDLGSTGGGFALSQAELDTITTSMLVLTAAADITLSRSVTLAPARVPTLVLESAAGGVVDGTATEQPDLTVESLAITVANGIGAAADLNLATSTLGFTNTAGAVNIQNSGALTIGSVGRAGVAGALTSSNDGTTTTISAAGPLTIAVETTTTGDTTYTAADGGAGDLLTINPGVTVAVTAGNLTLEGGDGISLPATAAATASGSVTLNVGNRLAADADGSSSSLLGTLTAGTAAAVVGGQGSDAVTVGLANGQALGVSLGAGNDTLSLIDGKTLNGGAFDGGADTDTLDYAAYSTGVAVNLGLGTAGLTATLEGGQEVPSRDTAATGTATLTYDAVTKLLDISLAVTGLAPGTVTGLHLHRGAFGVNGPIILDLLGLAPLVPSGTGFTLAATGIRLADSLLGGLVNEASLLGGITYLNIHTAAFPGGAIRGQVFSRGNVALTTGTATGTGGVTNVENVLGGSASDGLIGNAGANRLEGRGGNDTLLGGPGADTLLGGEADDVLVWSNGDGSDVMDGEAGNDTVQVNGSLGGATINDSFAINAGPGGRIDFRRVSAGSFALDIGTTESLTVNGIDGDDVFTVGDLSTVLDLTTLDLNGLDGDDTFNVLPGVMNVNGGRGANRLAVDASGTAQPRVVTVTNNLFDGGAGFAVNYRAPGGNYSRGVELATGGGADQVTVRSTAGPTALRTGGGNDVITIGALAGPLSAALVGAVTVDAGAGSNSLAVSEAASTAAGAVTAGPSSITGLTGAGFAVNYSAAGGGFGLVSYTGGLAGDAITYAGKQPGVMALNGGGGNDAFLVRLTQAVAPDGLRVDGGAGANTMTVQDASGGAVVRNQPTGPGAGNILVRYALNPISTFTYQNIQQVLGISDAANYVQALYHNALGRSGGPAEVAGWVSYMNQYGRLATARAIALSPEGRAYLVREWYLVFAGRAPTAAESAPLVQALLAGQSEESVLGRLVGAEAARGSAVRTALISYYYAAYLRRTGSAAEVTAWVRSANTIGGARLLFLASDEFFVNGL